MKNKNASELADKPKKVVFADFAGVKYNGVIESLQKLGVTCESVSDVSPLRHAHYRYLNRFVRREFTPRGNRGLSSWIQNIKKNTLNRELKIVVVTRQVP